MTSVDRYLAKTWSKAYDCRAFAREVWRDHTGKDVELAPSDRRRLTELSSPESPCLVLFRGREPHVGVYLRGKVLHLTERGAQHQELELAAIGFESVGFFR